MPTFITAPTFIAAAGNRPKTIEEYIGRVNPGASVFPVACCGVSERLE
jgi:hypothetical protein